MNNEPWWKQRLDTEFQQQQQNQQQGPQAGGNTGFFGNLVNTVKKDVSGGAKDVEHAGGKVLGFFGDMAKGTAEWAASGGKSLADIGKGAAASATNNKEALANANAAKQKDEPAFLSPLTRPFVQVARTIEHPFTPNSFQATSPEAQRVFGTAPVQNIAAGVESNYAQTHNPFEAALYGTGQVAQDALAVGAPELVGPEVRGALSDIGGAIRDAHGNLVPLDESGHLQLPGGAPEAPTGPEATPPNELQPNAPALDNTPVSELGGARPANDLQTQLETAWNNNDLGAAQQVIDQLPDDLKASTQSMQDAKLQGAAATVPDQHTQFAQALTGENPSLSEIPSREMTPDEQSHMEGVNATAASYNKPEDFITDIAKSALSEEKGKQVMLVPDGERYGYGQTRVSEHASWYSKLYGDLGHKPSLTATKDAVQSALESNRGSDLVEPWMRDAYQQLQDREQGLQQTIQQGPPPDIPANYMDSLAGKEQGVRSAPVSPQRKLPLGNAKGKAPQPLVDVQRPSVEFPENQRGFLGTMQLSHSLSDEARAKIADITPQTYDPYTNQEAMSAGRDIIGENKDAAYNKLLSMGTLDTNHEAAALQLIHQYSQDRNFDKMVAIADKLDEAGREHGRGVQIFSALNRMTPDGAVYYTNKLIGRAAEKIGGQRAFSKGLGEAKNIAKQYRKQINDAGAVGETDVRSAVNDLANRGGIPHGLKAEPGVGQMDIEGFSKDLPGKGINSDTSIPSGLPAKPGEGQLDINGKPFEKPNENPTTGEKVAQNVEKMATPAEKAKADVLVQEITKKVKQTMMEPKTATTRSPLDVMREVFSRNSEAQAAFPEAQRILMEKAKGNPRLQTALQKFFDSELGHPVSDSTVNAAIKDQLAKNETKVGDIITKSLSQQRDTIAQVAADLTKEGFDDASAKSIATDVVSRLEQQSKEAKEHALNALNKEVPTRYKKTFVEKINKLSNLGALSDGDYLDLAKAKLKLPHMTQELAQQVHDKAQQIQDMPEGYERDQAERELMHHVNESIPRTKTQKLSDLLSAPKALQATADISGVLHQGAVLGARFPKEWAGAFKAQITYMKSSDAFGRAMSDIKHDPAYDLAKRAKIDLTGVQGGEEAFASQLPERIKGVGKIVTASDRAYTGALTKLRFGAFTHMLQDMHDAGIDVNQIGDEQLQSIGKFINTASGRGHGVTGGTFEKIAPALNRTLFSPRLWKSRLDMLNPAYYYKLDPVSRKYALQSAGAFAGIAATVLGLGQMMGGKVETDPRSSDFLKLRFGDTRYDILGGFQQNLVFAARELAGSTKSSTSGEVKSLTGGGITGQNRLSILTDLVQNKENPLIGAGEDLLRGKTSIGQPVNPWTTVGSLAVPLSLQDMYGVATSQNPVAGLLAGEVPSGVGLGVTTYPAPGDIGETATSGSSNSSGFNAWQRSLNSR